MTWYVVNFNGVKYGPENLTGSAEKVLTGLGIHGFATEAQAVAHPQTMNYVQAALGGEQALTGINVTPGVVTPGSIATGAGDVASVVSGPDWQTIFLRVGEGLLGLLLIAVGVAKLTNAVPAATAIARRIP